MTDAEIRGLIDREVASRVDKGVQAEIAKITIQSADDISITGNLSGMTIGRNTGAAAPKAGAGSGSNGASNKSVVITDNGLANIYTIPATLIGPA